MVNMILNETIIRESVKQVINEYADRKHLMALYNYLMTDDAYHKNIEYEDYNDDQYLSTILYNNFDNISNFLLKNFKLDDRQKQYILNKINKRDFSLIDDIMNGDFSWMRDDILNTFKKTYQGKQYANDQNILRDEMVPEFINNRWLIHFSSNAEQIAKEGFAYGTRNVKALAYSGVGDISDKLGDGYDFAYDVNDFIEYYNMNNEMSEDEMSPVFTNKAVIFKSDGIKIFHANDFEKQVIFWGPSAKNFILLEYGMVKDMEWYIKSIKNGKIMYHNPDIKNVVDWAINNYGQYQKSMIDYKGNERFRRYETNYNVPNEFNTENTTWNEKDYARKYSKLKYKIGKKCIFLNKFFTPQEIFKTVREENKPSIKSYDSKNLVIKTKKTFKEILNNNGMKIKNEYDRHIFNHFLTIGTIKDEDIFIEELGDGRTTICYRPSINSYFLVLSKECLELALFDEL